MALICGVCLAAANFVKMMVVDCWLLANPTVTPAVAAVVCCTLVGTVACAKLVGASPAHFGGEDRVRPGGDGLALHQHHRGRAVSADLLSVCNLDPRRINHLKRLRLLCKNEELIAPRFLYNAVFSGIFQKHTNQCVSCVTAFFAMASSFSTVSFFDPHRKCTVSVIPFWRSFFTLISNFSI